MKKKLVIIGISLVLITIGLTGCFENGDNGSSSSGPNVIGDTDKFEIVEYKEYTFGPYITEKRSCEWTVDGFHYNDTASRYQLRGYARNICEETLTNVEVKTHWYDINNNLLKTESHSEANLEPGHSVTAFDEIYDWADYFADVHHVVLEIIVT